MRPFRSVAIVEDRAEDRFFLCHALRSVAENCRIFEFAYAEKALDFLRDPDRPALDLILVDIAMPRMDGFAFVDAYDALYPELRGRARLYIMSSSIDPRDRETAAAHRAISGFIEKPADAGGLARILG